MKLEAATKRADQGIDQLAQALDQGHSDTLAESLDYIQQTAAHIIVLLEVDSTVSLSR